MKLPCEVIRDLLPLYAEELTSIPSNKLIEEHLGDCRECSAALASMKTGDKTASIRPQAAASLGLVRNNIRKRKRKACIFAALAVFLVVFTLFSYLTKPIYVSYENSGAEVWEAQDGQWYVGFSERVTACRVYASSAGDGSPVKEVEAWTSVWDRILGTATPIALLSSAGKAPDTVYYCDYTTEQDNMTVIYGEDPNQNGGVITLPRLFPGVYFTAAAAAALGLGLAWFLLRKTKKAGAVCKYLFFVPASYVLSCLVLQNGFVSFSAARDFIMNVIGAAAIYGICLLGTQLIAQNREDRA